MAKTHPIIEFTDEELALEEWRPIAGTDDLVFVSSLGRVRSHLRRPGGRIRVATLRGKRLGVNIPVAGRIVTRKVHVLVANAFLGQRPDGEEVNHKDCNRVNNRASNLEWATPHANREHYEAYCAENGIIRGRARGRVTGAKLTPASVAEIRAKRAAGAKQRDLAAEYGVSITAISFVLSGRTWSWV